MAFQAVSVLGHLSPRPTLNTSAALLRTPFPTSLVMQNATAPACPGKLQSNPAAAAVPGAESARLPASPPLAPP